MVTKSSELSVRRQCELLGVNRSDIYRKPVAPDEGKRLRDEHDMARIDYWHTQMPYLGSRRIACRLRDEGIDIGRKRVRNLMCKMGLLAVYPKPNLSKRDFKESIVPYRLKNKLIFLPNQAWSIDITYLKMRGSHMYLTAIIDWYSRMIVGWNLSDTLDTVYVMQAVRDATEKYGAPAILNSDQGSQFTSAAYKLLLKELHIVQSMDGKSRWADNIMIERWFRSLKTEEIYINEYNSPRELRRSVARYIEQYNTQRPHSALNGAVPASVYAGLFINETKKSDKVA